MMRATDTVSWTNHVRVWDGKTGKVISRHTFPGPKMRLVDLFTSFASQLRRLRPFLKPKG